jgi:hypothetical protein
MDALTSILCTQITLPSACILLWCLRLLLHRTIAVPVSPEDPARRLDCNALRINGTAAAVCAAAVCVNAACTAVACWLQAWQLQAGQRWPTPLFRLRRLLRLRSLLLSAQLLPCICAFYINGWLFIS